MQELRTLCGLHVGKHYMDIPSGRKLHLLSTPGRHLVCRNYPTFLHAVAAACVDGCRDVALKPNIHTSTMLRLKAGV